MVVGANVEDPLDCRDRCGVACDLRDTLYAPNVRRQKSARIDIVMVCQSANFGFLKRDRQLWSYLTRYLQLTFDIGERAISSLSNSAELDDARELE